MHFFEHQGSQLAYTKTGSGPAILLFHGFGQDHTAFDSWVPALSRSFTVYAFDLYYHGNSRRENKKLSTLDWKAVLKQFLAEEKISRFSLGAFSLGGRFALATIVLFSTRVDHLILVAPDGIYRSPWYQIATNTPTKWLFKFLVNHPEGLFGLTNWIEKLGLINPSLAKFVKLELSQPGNLTRVYRSWVYFKSLLYQPPVLYWILRASDARVMTFLGKNDRIIPPSSVSPYFHANNVKIIDARHDKLVDHEIVLEYISSIKL